jgi:phage virion morphogenesis protein
MAGGFVSVDVTGSSSIVNAFNRLIKNIDDTSPALRDIGEYLTESTQQRFEDMETPDGEKWEELAPGTIINKQKTGQSDKILRGYGPLSDLLSYQLGNDQLQFGSNMEYAASMHFGRDSGNIPAREFLGFSEQDEDEILAIFHQYLSNS